MQKEIRKTTITLEKHIKTPYKYRKELQTVCREKKEKKRDKNDAKY